MLLGPAIAAKLRDLAFDFSSLGIEYDDLLGRSQKITVASTDKIP
jgi:hypothetical protein